MAHDSSLRKELVGLLQNQAPEVARTRRTKKLSPKTWAETWVECHQSSAY